MVERLLVIVAGSDRRHCEGLLCLPCGRSRKATLVDYAWLVDPHLLLVVWHPIEGLACDAN